MAASKLISLVHSLQEEFTIKLEGNKICTRYNFFELQSCFHVQDVQILFLNRISGCMNKFK